MALFDQFVNAPREYTIIPFWFLNDDLSEEELKRQIDDFEAHGVYGFIPHARMGLAERIGFMSPEWLHYTKVCVEHAAKKGMYVILYDEGMYPSGSCAGQVVAENARYAARCIERRPKGANIEDLEELVAEDEKWAYVHCRSLGTIRGVHYGQDDKEPGAPPAGDLLSPEAMACFRRLVLDRHYEALKEHFGKTVTAVFTDEPNIMGRGARKNGKPWTWGFAEYLRQTLGESFTPHLAALWDDAYPDAELLRRDYARVVEKRLQEVYYAPYSKWCEDHGVALTGHPAGPGDIGAERFFQIPGQDIVWRYIEPYQDKSIEGEQSTMAKCSVSAQRHYGRKRNGNECFGAYGWEFTYDEMIYITNWLFVRGVNFLMPHAFYYSLRDKRRDERPPDVGPNSPWWPKYKTYADYCRRMSWLLSNGRHVCKFAILGTANFLPWRAARVMFETQHDFNYLDIDTLKTRCKIEKDDAGKYVVRILDMAYEAVIVDGPKSVDADALEILEPMAEAGRVIAYGDSIKLAPNFAPDRDALVRALDVLVYPDVVLSFPAPGLRYTHMKCDEGDVYVFANEGKEAIDAKVYAAAGPAKQWWDPMAPAILEPSPKDRLVLPPLAMRVMVV